MTQKEKGRFLNNLVHNGRTSFAIMLLCIFVAVGILPVTFAGRCLRPSLEKCSCSRPTTRASNVVVDCTSAELNSVPRGIPPSVTHLILDDNSISTITSDSFGSGLPNLAFLSVRGNRLETVEKKAFRSLTSLSTLNLYNNSLKHKDSLPSSVFTLLRSSLKFLDIRLNLKSKNQSRLEYHESVSELEALETLKLDCLRNKPLPAAFGNLRSLRTLVFGGGSSGVVRLASDMFDAVADLGITEINMENLRLGYIENETLAKVKSLESLDLCNNPSLGGGVINVARALKDTAIRKLRLNNTNIGDHAIDLIHAVHIF